MIYPPNEDNFMYDSILNSSFKNYSFLPFRYELTRNLEEATLFIDPCNDDLFFLHDIIGTCVGDIMKNPVIYGNPFIRLRSDLDPTTMTNVLTHELGHYFGLPHSVDPMSVMYSSLTKATTLSRNDSLQLLSNYRHLFYKQLKF